MTLPSFPNISTMRFSLQKKFFWAFFAMAAVLVLLTTGIMHHQVREGFEDYITHAKIQRLGKVEAVLIHMNQQDGSLDVLRKTGAWNDLLSSIEAVRRDSANATLPNEANKPPVKTPEAQAREDKAIASSVSIMLQSRDKPETPAEKQVPPYARGVALLDANGFFLAGETVEDASTASYMPIRNAQRQVIAYWMVSRNNLAYDALGRAFVDDQFKGFLFMLAAAAVLSIIIAWALSMHFRRPIADLLFSFRKVAAGDLSTRLRAEDGGEVGDVAAHFNRMTAKLESQEFARKQWMADTSHELRTPLTVLRMRIEAMRDGIVPNTDEEWARSIKAIEDLSLLVDDLQLMARANEGQWELHLERMDANQWLSDIVDDHKPAFEKAGLTLNFKPWHLALPFCGDTQRLQQVMRNILVNSMRYTDSPGQVVIAVSPIVFEQQAAVQVVVSDSAPAVPATALPYLFDRFYRVDGSRNRATGGSGLGLSISQSIVQAHHGSITARNSDLGGLQITLVLPEKHDKSQFGNKFKKKE